jgi:multiple sugar transport system substrate-binding protein
MKKIFLGLVFTLFAFAFAQTEITYMAWGSPAELEVWQTIADEFSATHPDIKVTVDISDWGAYFEKLKTLFAGGTPPDVFAMDAPLYLDWQSRGVLMNLQPYIDKEAGMLDGFYPVTLQAYKLEDGYYGLPRDFQTIVLYYNKDMFDAAGIDYPTNDWTMEDLRTAAKALTLDEDGDGSPEQFGFSADFYDMELFWSGAIWGDGGEVISEDHTQTLLAEGSAREAWQLINDMMFEDGSIPDTDEAAQYGYDVFAGGGAAMTTIGHWVVPDYAQLGFKWDVAAFPAGSTGRATSVNSAGFVMAKDSKNADAAWEFIKYATGPSGQTRLTELGFAIPVLQAVAESPVYLEQKSANINHQVYLDALEYAHPKPVFKGYEEWSAVVGDGLSQVWTGDLTIDEALEEIVPAANDVLMNNQ